MKATEASANYGLHTVHIAGDSQMATMTGISSKGTLVCYYHYLLACVSLSCKKHALLTHTTAVCTRASAAAVPALQAIMMVVCASQGPIAAVLHLTIAPQVH
jgi:hypothetical protein